MIRQRSKRSINIIQNKEFSERVLFGGAINGVRLGGLNKAINRRKIYNFINSVLFILFLFKFYIYMTPKNYHCLSVCLFLAKGFVIANKIILKDVINCIHILDEFYVHFH